MILLIVLLAIALVAFVYFVGIYNGLVALRERVKQAWADIDVLLRQRHDELPRLVDTCRQAMPSAHQTLESLMQARAAVFQAREGGDAAAVGTAEQQLRACLDQLFAAAADSPPLQASESFQQLQQRIGALGASIGERRERYNEQVRLNNTRVGQFPDLLIARRYGFTVRPLLEFADAGVTEKGEGRPGGNSSRG